MPDQNPPPTKTGDYDAPTPPPPPPPKTGDYDAPATPPQTGSTGSGGGSTGGKTGDYGA